MITVLPDDPEDADPQLARERTEMAWTRSSIAFFAVGVAIVKFSPAVGILILAIAGITWLLGHAAATPGKPGVVLRRPLLVTVAVTGLAAFALVLVLAGPSSIELRP